MNDSDRFQIQKKVDALNLGNNCCVYYLPITMPSLSCALLQIPDSMTEEDFEFLMKTIASFKDALATRKAPTP